MLGGRLDGGCTLHVYRADRATHSVRFKLEGPATTPDHASFAMGAARDHAKSTGQITSITLWGSYDTLYGVGITADQVRFLEALHVDLHRDIMWEQDSDELWEDIVAEGTGRSGELQISEFMARFSSYHACAEVVQAARRSTFAATQVGTTAVVRSWQDASVQSVRGFDDRILEVLPVTPGAVSHCRVRFIALAGTGRPYLQLSRDGLALLARLGASFEVLVAP